MDTALGKFLPSRTKSGGDSVPTQAAIVAKSKSSGATAKPPAAPVAKKKYRIDDFSIQATLGTGSFGRVHLVRNKIDNKFAAMKVLRKNDIVKLRQVEHTVNEKNILELLDMPFLVKMYGTFQDSNCLFIVLEYIQGGELFSYLRKSGVRYAFYIFKAYSMTVLTHH